MLMMHDPSTAICPAPPKRSLHDAGDAWPLLAPCGICPAMLKPRAHDARDAWPLYRHLSRPRQSAPFMMLVMHGPSRHVASVQLCRSKELMMLIMHGPSTAICPAPPKRSLHDAGDAWPLLAPCGICPAMPKQRAHDAHDAWPLYCHLPRPRQSAPFMMLVMHGLVAPCGICPAMPKQRAHDAHNAWPLYCHLPSPAKALAS